MSSTELVVPDRAQQQQEVVRRESDELTDLQRLGKLLAASGYFADAREMAQAAVKVMAGKELGIPPIAAMMGINVIKGKIALGGNLIASRVRAHGYDYKVKQLDKTGCVLEFLSRVMDGKRTVLGESSFTEEDAKTAGVFSDMYKKYPKNMYFNRAMSNGAKTFTPEVLCGLPVYTPEELGATVDGEGEVVHEQESREAVASRRIAEEKAKANEPKQTEAPTSAFKKALEEFAAIKERIGAPTYYRMLGLHGFEHANEIRSTAKMREIFKEMVAEEKDRKEASAQSSTYVEPGVEV